MQNYDRGRGSRTNVYCVPPFKKNVILGTDFAKNNQAGVSWTKQGTRILSIKGVARLEVEEDELGNPVTTKHHVKIPLRYSAVFEVNLHGACEGPKNNFT